MPADEILVQAAGVSKQYHLGKTTITALRGLSLNIQRGSFVVIAGPSGSGKSTLLNLLGCLDHPTSGSIQIAGQDVAKLRDNALSAFRARRMGFIFQSFNLVPVLSAFENVEYPLRLNRVPHREMKERTMAMLESVGLEGHARHRPSELSGGQRQRVAIARALVTHPDLVLADEPTANLDSVTGGRIVDLMHAMQERSGTAFVIATHDEMVAARAHDVHKLHDGKLES
jgi:putative ABC transport system ATP-binding protein